MTIRRLTVNVLDFDLCGRSRQIAVEIEWGDRGRSVFSRMVPIDDFESFFDYLWREIGDVMRKVGKGEVPRSGEGLFK